MKLKLALASLALLALPALAFAAPITYPGSPATDSSTGAAVTSGVTVSIASVTDLDGNAKSTGFAAAHVAGGNTSAVYDAAANGEAWVTLSLTASGHTFAPVVIFCSSDPSTLAANGTAIAALPAANASALLGASFLTIPGDHTTSGTAETLTFKQMQAILLAVPGSDNASTAPAASSMATTSYYLAGQPQTTANLVYIGTVTYNASGLPSGRTVKIAQPFPAIN